MDVEQKSKRLDQKAKKIEQESQAELLASAIERIPLPTAEEIEEFSSNLQAVLQRIQEIQRVLLNFKTMAEEGKSRQEYVDVWMNDLCLYYGYNSWLIEQLFHLFSVVEVMNRN